MDLLLSRDESEEYDAEDDVDRLRLLRSTVSKTGTGGGSCCEFKNSSLSFRWVVRAGGEREARVDMVDTEENES